MVSPPTYRGTLLPGQLHAPDTWQPLCSCYAVLCVCVCIVIMDECVRGVRVFYSGVFVSHVLQPSQTKVW